MVERSESFVSHLQLSVTYTVLGDVKTLHRDQ